jgi:hypothetical protein
MDSSWTFESGDVRGEGIGDISMTFRSVSASRCVALSRSLSVSVSVGEPKMEHGLPVVRKKQTDSSSPSLSLKRTIFPHAERELTRESGEADAEAVLQLQELERLRHDLTNRDDRGDRRADALFATGPSGACGGGDITGDEDGRACTSESGTCFRYGRLPVPVTTEM